MRFPCSTLTAHTSPAARDGNTALALLFTVLCLLLVCMHTPANAARVPVPPYSARVLDTTGTLDGAQTASLNEKILALEADTQAAVVVFMVPSTGEDSIEEYATRVFETWQLGDTDRDDGILILVAKQDRRMRIEVGLGLEGTVPDVLAGRIIDQQMKPRFRDNDYAGGLGAAINSLGALVRGDEQATESHAGIEAAAITGDSRGGRSASITPFGWAFFATLAWGFAVGVVRTRRAWTWPATAGVVAAAPVLASALLLDIGMAAVLLSFPAPVAFALGFGCARSKAVRILAGSLLLIIGVLVGIGYAVGADRFAWGFLYAMVGGMVCLLLSLIVMGVRMAYKRSVIELCVRGAIVAGIVAFVAVENPPGAIVPDWTSWIPIALATGLSMLFIFFPSDGSSSSSGGGGSSSSSSSSSSSRSSSSSSSRSSSGGSSSGGGASGSW